MDTGDLTVDINVHIEGGNFIDVFDCPNTILSDMETFNTALVITKNFADILSNHTIVLKPLINI